MAVNRLVQQCPPLDTNSSYCNLLQCSHFANTATAAVLVDEQGREEELVGFVSGHIPPQQSDTFFLWQVAVGEKARGLGLASRMTINILSRLACGQVRFLETTITEDNQASWALFKGLAEKLSTKYTSSVWMDKDTHFDGQHDSETLVRIGPFNPPLSQPADKA